MLGCCTATRLPEARRLNPSSLTKRSGSGAVTVTNHLRTARRDPVRPPHPTPVTMPAAPLPAAPRSGDEPPEGRAGQYRGHGLPPPASGSRPPLPARPGPLGAGAVAAATRHCHPPRSPPALPGAHRSLGAPGAPHPAGGGARVTPSRE